MSNNRILILAGVGLGVLAVILALTTGASSLWWSLIIFGIAIYTIAVGVTRQRHDS